MKVSTIALVAALALTANSAGAYAQGRAHGDQNGNGRAQAQQPRYNLSRAEQAALQPLIQADSAAQTARAAGQTPNYAAVQALMPAAVAAARGNDAKYLVGRIQLNIALNGSDEAAQVAAINALLANPSTPAAEQEQLRNGLDAISQRQAVAAFDRQDFQTAANLFRQVAQRHPNDPQLRNNLAIAESRLGNTAPLRDVSLQNVRTAEAAGRPGSESDYRNLLAIANRAHDHAQMAEWAAKLAQNYPSTANWRTAIDVARQGAPVNDNQMLVDIYRLAVKTNSLQPNEYVPLANTLRQASLAAEARSVLQAGIAANAIQSSAVGSTMSELDARARQDQATLSGEIQQARSAANGRQASNVATALYGLGRYQEAADLYRVALTKGGEDANLVNTRLGMSLAAAGNRAEAEAAFRAVTGPRQELARLWLAWLTRAGNAAR